MKRKLSPWGIIAPLAGAMMLTTAAFAADIEYPGLVKVENFDGINGDPVENLLAAPKYINNQPDSVTFLNSLYWSRNPAADNYGSRITGYLTPPETGEYVFYIASDNNSWLYLSTDSSPANLKLIAADQGWQDSRTWTGPGGMDANQNPPWRRGNRLTGEGPYENRSDQFYTSPLSNLVTAATRWPTTNAAGNAVITLTNGVKYYFQYLFKEGGGGDNGGVAWRKPSDTEDPANGVAGTEIGAEYISMIYSDTMTFKTQPTNVTVFQGQQVNLVSEANAFPGGITYQWYDNGVPIDQANSPTLLIPSATVADNNGHKYKVTVTSDADPSKVITSAEITVTVNNDTVAPTVLRIRTSEDLKTVRVYYSEPVGDEAINTANYVFNPTMTVTDAIWDTDLHQEALILPVIGSDPHVATDPRHRASVILFVTGMTTNMTYSLAVNNVKDLAGNALVPNTKPVSSPVFMPGVLNFKRWMGSGSIQNLWSDTARFENPSTTGNLSLAETGSYSDRDNDYVARISGYFIPPANGDYVFFVSADNDGFLFLSTDSDPANLRAVAADVGWQNARTWTGPGGQDVNQTPQWRRGERTTGTGPFENRTDQFLTSPRGGGTGIPPGFPIGWETTDDTGNQKITLVAGQKYYFELYQAEFDGGHVEVNYKLTTEADPANGTATRVTGNVIGALVDPSSLLPTISAQPTNTTFTLGGTLTLSVTGNSSAPLSYQWFRNGVAIAGATSSTLTINNAAITDAGLYTVAVSNENGSVTSASAAATTSQNFTFQEDATGLTSMEAEHYSSQRAATDGHAWIFQTTRPGFSGTGYMTPLPDSGVNLGNTGFIDTAARLDFKVNFQKTGTHYIWLRGGAPAADGAGDSIHAGLDGAVPATATRIDGNPTFNIATGWNWVGNIQGNTRASVEVATTGEHTFSLWMREDGIVIDKVVLTTDAAFTPADLGPTESASGGGSTPTLSVSRSGGTVTITYTGTLVSSTTVNGTYAPVAGATGGTYTVPAGSGTVFFQAKQ